MTIHDLTHLSPEEAQRVMRSKMSERELQERVEALLVANGWKFIHVRDARRQNVEGWPDLVAFRGPRRLAAELKTRRGQVTPAQQGWLDVLDAAGFDTFVLRPMDIDWIAETLK